MSIWTGHQNLRGDMERRASDVLELPGFRFHPTEEELLEFYLRRMVQGKKLDVDIIGMLNIYRHDPWDLPKLARIGENEWYFIVPRDRKQANGGRPNRTTERGFWKATGSDRPIRSAADPKRLIGLKKTLVFYIGRAPRGRKTDWVMNEYRLPDPSSSTAPAKEDIVLCKVYRKATTQKELEQRAATEEELSTSLSQPSCISITTDSNVSFCHRDNFPFSLPPDDGEVMDLNKDMFQEIKVSSTLSSRGVKLPELQVPKHGLEWMQDSFLSQLRSPWPEQWSPFYANVSHV